MWALKDNVMKFFKKTQFLRLLQAIKTHFAVFNPAKIKLCSHSLNKTSVKLTTTGFLINILLKVHFVNPCAVYHLLELKKVVKNKSRKFSK